MDTQPRQPLLLVLIEDYAADERFFREILKNVPIATTLRVARDGVEALALLQTLSEDASSAVPDVVFLDLHLPKKDGYEVLGEIDANPTLRQVPVWVFVTAMQDLSEATLARRGLAVAGYLRKPVGVEALTELLRPYVEKRKARRPQD
jgi:CheY-like chemotaxis protein